MFSQTPGSERPSRGGGAASLNLIELRRVDRKARSGAKTSGDLTAQLRRPAQARSVPVPAQPEAPKFEPAKPEAPRFEPAQPEVPRFEPAKPEQNAVESAAIPEQNAVESAPIPEAPQAYQPQPHLPEPYQPYQKVTPAAPELPLPEPAADPLRHVPDRLVSADVVTYVARLAPLPEAAPPPPRPAPLPYDDLRTTDELIDYWDDLRDGRELPFFTSLDRTRIAISWPDTLMVTFERDVPQVTRLSRLTGEVEYSSLVTEWILACARQVSRIGKAMEHEEKFEGSRDIRTYRLILLPFATPAGKSDHILCHLDTAA